MRLAQSAKTLRLHHPGVAAILADIIDEPMTVEIVGSAFGNCDPVPFTTLNEASAKYRAFLDQHGLGSRDAGSCYIRQHGRIVAHVSYNGRVWAGATWNGKDQPLFAP